MTKDSDAQDLGVRRIVVGVDGSMESVAALRWAGREASLRAAEGLAVRAMESACHPAAGPVIRVCLRAARCPVVIIGAVDALTPDPSDHVPESWQRALQGSGAAR